MVYYNADVKEFNVSIYVLGLMRSGKSCRLRWKNYLRPNIKRGMMSEDEKDLIIRLHKLLGNRSLFPPLLSC